MKQRQKILFLTFVSGILRLIVESGNATDECKSDVEAAEFQCTWIVNRMLRQTDKPASVKRWVDNKRREWSGDGEEMLPVASLATTALNYCEDILEHEPPGFSRSSIESIRDKLIKISYHFAELDRFEDEHFEHASRLTIEVYDVIGV